MTKTEAAQELVLLLGSAVHSQLTNEEQDWCLEKANSGGDYDAWIAAAEAAELLGRRALAGGLKQFTADGATFVKQPADWFTMAATFRAKSPRDTTFYFDIV